jgi:hypothetical protein
MGKGMAKVSWFMITVDSMRVIGIGTKDLEKHLKNFRTAAATSVTTNVAKLMAKASSNGLMEKSLMASGVKDSSKDTVFGAASSKTPTSANVIAQELMDRVFTFTGMATSLRDSGSGG